MTIKLSVCIDMIYRELPFSERMEKIAALGYPAYEFWGLSDKNLGAIADKQAELGLSCATFMGNGRVSLVDRSKKSEFIDALGQAIAIAKTLATTTLLCTVGQELPNVSRQAQHEAIVEALRAASGPCEAAGVTLVVEPLNILVNHQGYFLSTSAEGFAIVNEVKSQSVKLLYDIYHQQITEGNLISTIRANVDKIGHFHVADVPGRHEPGTGEINYRKVFEAVAETDYSRYVGLEYRPESDTAETLEGVKRLASGL